MKLNNRKNFTAFLLIFFILGCSGSDDKSDSMKPEIKVEFTEAWLDFMPVVIEEDKNRFGFVIDLNFKGNDLDTNYKIRDFKIKLNNDSLNGKKFNVRYKDYSDTSFNMEIYQQYDENYLDKNKEYPEETEFSFGIFRENKIVKKISTPKIKILKTQ